MGEDQTPFQYCLCSFSYVNTKVRERESSLSVLMQESNASSKGGKELELLLLEGEWDSKICMQLIFKIHIFSLSHLGQESLMSVMAYIQLVPTPFRFLHLCGDLCVGQNEKISRKERRWGPCFHSSWTTRLRGKVNCRNYFCRVLERLILPAEEVMLKVTLLMLYV